MSKSNTQPKITKVSREESICISALRKKGWILSELMRSSKAFVMCKGKHPSSRKVYSIAIRGDRTYINHGKKTAAYHVTSFKSVQRVA